MKKLLLVAILMLALVVTAAACTEDPSDPADTGAVTTAGENATETDPAETTAAPADTDVADTDAADTDAADTDAAETTAADTNEAETKDPAASVIVIDPRDLPAGSISGHQTNIVDSAESYPDHYPMIEAAGLTSGAMIHQGSIYLGEFDLTKYAKVVIYYATDWSEGTQSALATAKGEGHGYLGLSAIDCNNVINPDRDYFIGEQYTPAGGWTVTAHELPNVADSGYSGPVYVSADILTGQFIIIDRVEFYPAE